MITNFRISCIDRIGTKLEMINLVESALCKDLKIGNHRGFLLYKDSVFIHVDDDVIDLSKLGLNIKDEQILDAKDLIVNKLVDDFNARKICVATQKEDGFSKHDFIPCEKFNPPKKTFIHKLMELLSN